MVVTTASTIGIIIAVAAVFEIHMDRNDVVNIKANITEVGLVPVKRSFEFYATTELRPSTDLLAARETKRCDDAVQNSLLQWP